MEKVGKKLKGKNRARQIAKSNQASTTTDDYRNNIIEKQKKEEKISEITMHHDRDDSYKVDVKVEAFTLYVAGKKLFEDADLTINFGRRYVLIGRNGTGKTSLLNHIAHKEIEGIPEHLQILHVQQEEVATKLPLLEEVVRCDVERYNLLNRNIEISAILENTSNPLPEEEISKLTSEMVKISNRLQQIGVDEAENNAIIILRGLGFSDEDLHKPTNQFSGGWRVRISLAKALFVQPDILLLDEPTNHLDMNAVMWLENYLIDWPYTIVIVSHARDFINTVATDIMLIENGKMTYYKGNYDEFVKAKSDKMIHQKKEKEKQNKQVSAMTDFINQFRANAARAALVQSRIKEMNKMVIIEDVYEDPPIKFKFPNPTELSPPLLKLHNANLGYSKEKPILSNVEFYIDMESRIAIVGPNGAGKSTLMKSITGELEVLGGEFFRHGKLKLAFFTQHHIDQLNLEFTPIEQIGSMDSDLKEEKIRSHLANFGISSVLMDKPNHVLSGGQKTRVALAALVYNEPEIIIMDEPTNHLDIDAVNALALALNNYTGGICIVSHDSHFVEAVCNKIYVVENHKVELFDGTFQDYKKDLRQKLFK